VALAPSGMSGIVCWVRPNVAFETDRPKGCLGQRLDVAASGCGFIQIHPDTPPPGPSFRSLCRTHRSQCLRSGSASQCECGRQDRPIVFVAAREAFQAGVGLTYPVGSFRRSNTSARHGDGFRCRVATLKKWFRSCGLRVIACRRTGIIQEPGLPATLSSPFGYLSTRARSRAKISLAPRP
jgi:hypothetical protein